MLFAPAKVSGQGEQETVCVTCNPSLLFSMFIKLLDIIIRTLSGSKPGGVRSEIWPYRDRYLWPGLIAMSRSIKSTCAKFQSLWNARFARRRFGPIWEFV